MDISQDPLTDSDRGRLRTSVWLMVAAAALALVGIFGFGGLTGAGDYFDEATRDAAVRDFYWQIWGILLPLAIATVISGISLFLLAGVLSRMGSGWTSQVTTAARWVVLPATALASVPYWLGPEIDELELPSWFEALAGVAGMLAYAAVIAMGVAILGLPMPKWTGVGLILGALAAFATFLPLFVFVGTLAGGIGILRWNRKGLDAADGTPPVTAGGI
jgi:hypothetical protein